MLIRVIRVHPRGEVKVILPPSPHPPPPPPNPQANKWQLGIEWNGIKGYGVGTDFFFSLLSLLHR